MLILCASFPGVKAEYQDKTKEGLYTPLYETLLMDGQTTSVLRGVSGGRWPSASCGRHHLARQNADELLPHARHPPSAQTAENDGAENPETRHHVLLHLNPKFTSKMFL
jgi:hypothetical protein